MRSVITGNSTNSTGYYYYMDGYDLIASIKSSIGLGILLKQGIGDTIRVSLSKDELTQLTFVQLLKFHNSARWLKKSSEDFQVHQ